MPQWSAVSLPGCSAPCGSQGTRALDYACVSSTGAVLAESDCIDSRPQGTELCFSSCLHISPAGDDAAEGSLSAPLRSAEACLRNWSLSSCGEGCTVVHRCILHEGVYYEATSSTQRSDLTLEAYENEEVLFDASDAVAAIDWHAASTAGIWVADLAAVPRLAALIVDGEAAHCEVKETCTPSFEEPDACEGAVEPEVSCFVFAPEVSWARRFSSSDAARCFAPATDAPEAERCAGVLPESAGAATGTWWWWDDAGGLRVHRESFTNVTGRAWPPAVRLKAADRSLAFDFGAGSSGILFRGLRFRGAGVRVSASRLTSLQVADCRFLYAPVTAATLSTYTGSGRGGGSRVWLTSSVFEFAEGAQDGAAFVKGRQAVVEDNYFAFNDHASRARYTVGSWSKVNMALPF